MDSTREEKIKKLQADIGSARTLKQKCSLLIDLAMEHQYSNPAAALQEAEQALAIAKEINFVPGKGRSYFCMGLVYMNRSEYEQALTFLNHAYHCFTEAGDQWGSSNALNNIGLIYLRLGNYTRALEYFSSSLHVKRESHDDFGTANVMISMAAIHRETGNLADAQLLLTESLKISKEIKANALTAKGLMELGITLSLGKEISGATGKFLEAKGFFEKLNNLSGIAQCFLHLGKIKSASDDSPEAISLLEEGLRIAAGTGDKSLISIFLYSMAAEKLKSNEPDDALALLTDAKKIAEKTEEKPMLAMISELLSRVYETTGDFKEALSGYKNFIALKQEINSAETAVLLSNQKISARVEALELKNKMLELEKLVAIGQLTAGIAHEINNPVNFIASNISPVRKNISDIVTLLEHYEAQLPDNSGEEQSLSPAKMRHSLEINFAIDETNQLLNGVENGARRIKEIVSALRLITRLNEESFKPADVQEEIDAALLLLKNKTGNDTIIVKEYGGVAPFEHYPALLSRALMNILQNALEATANGGQVIIKTFEENNNVCISITDSGKGMAENVKRKIFDPFFTTKEVGAGMGLGLPVAKSILEQHGGTIELESETGKGTQVKLIIPKRF